ncbi:TPA: hypothetical protein OQU49_004374 [Shigella flexneri]|nr:hypothetical protein [Shigella flexneri]
MSEFAARIAEVVALGRINAEALMTDRVQVWRESTDEPTMGEWGEVIPAPPTLVYDGPAKGQNDRTYPNSPNVADSARVVLMIAHVHFPHGTTAIQSGDVVEWVSSQNPRLVGRKVRLRVDSDKTWNTSVRFNVEEVVVK